MNDLKIPEFELSFQENLNQISNIENIHKQIIFFEKYFFKLQRFNRDLLTKDQIYQYDTVIFEIKLNLERLSLEKQYKEDSPQDSYERIFYLPNNKQWYAFYTKKWTSTAMTPEEIFNYGLNEVKRIVAEYKKIQKKLGYENKDEAFYAYLNSAAFLVTNETKLIKTFLAAACPKKFEKNI